MSSTPVLPQTPVITPVQILNATGTAGINCASAGANGTKVVAMMATSSDTVSHVVQIYLLRSATAYLLGATTIAALSGTSSAAPTVNMLDPTIVCGLPVDNDGQHYFFLKSGDTLQVASTDTVGSGKNINVITLQGDF